MADEQKQQEVPPHVTEEPKIPENVQLTEKQKTAQYIVQQMLGMVRSRWSVVMFKNTPLVWLQYFAGISMGMPTIMVVKKSDAEWIPSMKHPLVKAVFQIEEFKEPYAGHMSEKIARFIKKHDKEA